MARYLIVNADDFGLSAGVNRGILEAHQRGIVTSTTTMVNLPDVEAGIRAAQQGAPDLGLGVHFVLSYGAPVSPAEAIPSLVQADGSFYSTFEALTRQIPSFTVADLQTELRAQIERFIQLAGRPPDHLDSHHHSTYWYPAALAVMLDLAAEYDLPIRNGMSLLDSGDVPADELRDVYAAHPGARWPEFFAGGFYGETATLDVLLDILTHLPDGVTELMCHPGYANDIQEAYAAPRETELKLLTEAHVRETIEQQAIQLITFANLPR